MASLEKLPTQPKFGIRPSLDGQLHLENRERSLARQVVLVANIARGAGDEIAIALSKEGAQIIGIVGNSRKEQEDAKKLAIHIDYSGGDIDFVYADTASPEGREKLQGAVGKVDIVIVDSLHAEVNNVLVDELLVYMREGGKIILVGHEDGAMESLREKVQISPEFHEKDISFFVVCPPVERIEEVGEKVAEILKRED